MNNSITRKITLLFTLLLIAFFSNAQKTNQQITFQSIPNQVFGTAPFGLSATSSSGLAVTFTSSNLQIATVSGATLTINGAGSVQITASQAGNDTINAASDVVQTLTVVKANQVITFPALPSKTYGDPGFTLLATSSAGLPVSYTTSNVNVAAVSVSFLEINGAGTSTITAIQAGNANFNPASSVIQPLVVAKAPQGIFISPLPDQTFGNGPLSLSGIATSGLPISYVSDNNDIVSIQGSYAVINGAGTVTITASQSGNDNYLPSGDYPIPLVVNKATQTINFSISDIHVFGDAPFTLQPSATSGLPVLLTSQYDTIATITGNEINIVGAGSSVITATQNGNNNYLPATTTQTLVINKAPQTITFAALPAKKFGDGPFSLSATATSGLPVTFSSSRRPIASVSANVVTMLAAGTASIIASQQGNSNYLPAADVSQNIVISGLGNSYPLVGTTLYGGNGKGTIFNMNSDGTAFSIQKNFSVAANASPQAGFIKASDGRFYGTLWLGGSSGSGAVIGINKDGSGYSVVHDFKTTDGQMPFGNVMEGADGALYGMTNNGGSGYAGVIFKVNKDGSGFTVLYNFPSSQVNGGNPLGGFIQLSDGSLYGTTLAGGSADYGTVFKIQPDGSGLTTLVNFDRYGNGGHPKNDLVLGPDGFLYGTGNAGGVNDLGVLFKVKPDGTGYTKLIVFDGATYGSNPIGNPIIATDGRIYAATQLGGANSKGTLFSINTDGTGYRRLFDFDGANSGYLPSSTLVQSVADGALYGTTYQGGASDYGTIFKINTDGTGFAKLLDFNGTNGGYPNFGPLLETDPGTFIGMSSIGGTSNTGAIFTITSTGTFTSIKNFPQPEGVPLSFVPDAQQQNFYGVAELGSTYGNGAIFKTSADGSGYQKLGDVEGSFVTSAHAIPLTDGSVFGIGTDGSSGYFLYRTGTDGTGFQRVFAFDNLATKGDQPTFILQGPDGLIYGTTLLGGGGGTLFRINSDGTGFTRLAEIPGGTSGQLPYANIILTSDGEFIGTTQEGGANNNGTLFKFTSSYQFVKLFDFTNASGASPQKIIQLSDGSIVVLAATLGANDAGAVFGIGKDGNDYYKLYDFDYLNSGNIPLDLIQSVDGYLIGVCREGGPGENGTIYQMLTDGSDFKVIFQFNGTNGSEPNTLFFRKHDQVIAFDAPPAKKYGDEPFALSASSSSGLPVIFTSSDPSIVSISGNVVTIHSVGTVTITASVASNKNFNPAASVQRDLVIGKSDQTISFATVPTTVIGSPAFNLSATSSSGLPVTFSSASPHIIVSGTAVTLKNAGSVTVEADQSGDSDFTAAPEVPQTFCINPVKPMIGAAAQSQGTALLTSSVFDDNQWFKDGVAITGATASTLIATTDGSYTVQVNVEGCLSEMSDAKAVVITGIEPATAMDVTLYPNPASGKINLDLSMFNGQDVQVKILNSTGRNMYQDTSAGAIATIDVAFLTPGLYIIEVKGSSATRRLRLIKE